MKNMFGFLTKRKEKETITQVEEVRKPGSAEEIQLFLFSLICSRLDEMINKTSLIPSHIISKYTESKASRLQKLGFSSCKDVEDYNDQRKLQGEIEIKNREIERLNQRKLEFLRLYLKLQEATNFGALLVDFRDFENIMSKYGLVCGELQDYTGEVPDKQLEIIEGVHELLCSGMRSEGVLRDLRVKHIKKIREVKISFNIRQREFDGDLDKIEEDLKLIVSRFPFVSTGDIDQKYYERIEENRKRYDREYKDIYCCTLERERERQIERDKETEIRVLIQNQLLDISEEAKKYKDIFYVSDVNYDDWGYNRNLFICAPSNEIKNSPEVKTNFLPDDPMVCALTGLGVIVFTAWGKEAEDTMLDKYKQFNYKVRSFLESQQL